MGSAIFIRPRLLFLLFLPFVVTFLIFRSLNKQRKQRPVVHVRESFRSAPVACAPFLKSCSNRRHPPQSAEQRSPQQPPELARSIATSGLVASILCLGLYYLMAPAFRARIFPALENIVLFTAVSILATWFILAAQMLTWNVTLSKSRRLLIRTGIGAITGICAFGLQQFLNVHLPTTAYTVKSAMHSLGSHPFIEAGSDPTCLGYAVFFGGWFLIGRATKELNADRGKRFSLGLTAKSVLMGFLTSLIFAFPQWYAMLWAATISSTIQIASTWSPKSELGRGS